MYSRLLLTLTLPAAVLLGASCADPVAVVAEEKPAAKEAPAAVRGDWPMYGGTPGHNLVNTLAQGIPSDWEPKPGGTNIKWVAEVAKYQDGIYVPPAVAGGRVYVPTNNTKGYDETVKGDKAVLMCFNEADGKFLWQIAHDLPGSLVAVGGRSVGLMSTPAV